MRVKKLPNKVTYHIMLGKNILNNKTINREYNYAK